MNYSKMTKDQLLKEMAKITKQLRKMQEVVDVKESHELNIGGFTCKDVAVRYGSYDGSGDHDADINFSFFLKKNGKLWDFYYGKSDGEAEDWWPEAENDMNMSPIFDFIPPGFAEACENSYEFSGTVEEAIEHLKKHGITDIEKGDW